MKVSFELTMPNVGSWNGKWTGADRKYYLIRGYGRTKAHKELINSRLGGNLAAKNYRYSWNDGWGVNVHMELVTDQEARRRQKLSRGFCGYEWMIDSIISHGTILDSSKIKELQP